ncbi:MAG TPA: transposase [Terriglobales bacterium]
MPWGLRRFHGSGQSHFVTFSCFHRKPFLITYETKKTFEAVLERTRRLYRFRVYGYVIMPEHVHLLVSEPERRTLAMAIQSLKQAVSRLTKDAPKPFWQSRYYDSNLFTYEDFVRALQYIHRNPSRRGLCEKPEDWPWSSFCHYANGEERTVEIESEWTARRRERMSTVEQPHPSKGS